MRWAAGVGLVLLVASAVGAASAQRDEKSLFFMPKDSDFRFQDVGQGPNETNWPFAEAEGTLSCAWILGARMVTYFPRSIVDCQCADPENPDEVAADNETLPHLSISTDPFELIFVNMAHRRLFAPTASTEELIKRVAPLYAIGLKLCDQPQGTYLRRSEL
jgi:hypothetical protein